MDKRFFDLAKESMPSLFNDNIVEGIGNVNNDIEKIKYSLDLDSRYTRALARHRSAMADDDLAKEIQVIISDCEKLSEIEAPRMLYNTNEEWQNKIKNKISRLRCLLAMTYSIMMPPKHELAICEYTEASRIYKEIKDLKRSKRCEEYIANIIILQTENIDDELQLLNKRLDEVENSSLDRVSILIDIANFYRRNGDEYESEKLLNKAQNILESIGADPSGSEIAESLLETVSMIQNLKDGQENPSLDNSPLGISIQKDQHYLLLYFSFARLYKRSDPGRAMKYRELTMKAETNPFNESFRQKVVTNLDQLFKE